MDRYEAVGYAKTALVGALAALLTVWAVGEWKTWVAVRNFVVPIMAQQAAQQRPQPAAPKPVASPEAGK